MKRKVVGFYRCGTAFRCKNCNERIIMGELFTKVAVFPDRGFPTEQKLCIKCGKEIQDVQND